MDNDLGTIQNRGPFRRASLKQYIKQMSSPNKHIVFDDSVADVLSEQGFSWEEDPRSIYDPEQMWLRLADYGRKIDCKWDESLKYGFRCARKIFGKTDSYLEPLQDNEQIKQALKLNKSAGLPTLAKKVDSLVYSFDREQQVRLGLKSPNPCVAYKRTQANNKTRLVWGYPLEMTIMEARFARPLITRFLAKRTTMSFGLMKFELGTYIEYDIKGKGYVYGLDYSKFDSSISSSMIKESFDILGTWFSKQDKLNWGWDQMLTFFLNTPIVMPDGNLYTGKRHGVPSGSYFTQLVDSIVNTALIFAISRHFQCKLHWKSLLVLGDDSLFAMDRRIPLKFIATKLLDYGIKMNVEKSTNNELHFLGATWDKTLPDGELKSLASKAVFPETYRHYESGKSRRQQAISVLRSYASQYVSAWKFVPPIRMALANHDDLGDMTVGFGLSGSDRFHIEYMLPKMNYNYSPVSLRMLL